MASQNKFDEKEWLKELAARLKKESRHPNIKKYEPHAKQLQFHRSNKQMKLYIGGNRCLAEGTLVLMADGSQRAIESIAPGDVVFSRYGTPTKVVETYENGMKPVYRHTLKRYGRTDFIDCTEDHFFDGFYRSTSKKYKSGFRQIQHLDRLLRSQGTNVGYEVDSFWPTILGLMLSNGYLADSALNMTFSTKDEELLEDCPWFIKTAGNNYSYTLIPAYQVFWQFQEWGLIGTRSASKFIPSVVWNWNETAIRYLIGSMIATDGSIYCNSEGQWHVGFNSNSYELIQEFQRLCELRLGIWGSSINHDGRQTYGLTFGTKQAVEAIMQLPIPGKKKHNNPQFKRNSQSDWLSIDHRRFIGYKPTYDIHIDHESHVFMLANGLYCSNSGKTVGGVTEGIWRASGTHPYRPELNERVPTQGRVIGVDFVNGVEKIIFPQYQQWLAPSMLRGGSWETAYDKVLRTLHFDNGSTIEFMSYDQELDKFAGTSRDWVHFDEEPPLSIFNENRARLIDTDGDYWITMTPVEGMTWVYDDLFEGHVNNEDSPVEIIQIQTKENPYLSQSAIQKYRDSIDEDEEAIRLSGEFVQMGGRIYGNFDPTTGGEHVLKEPISNPSKYFKDWLWIMGLDHGLNNPTAVVWIAVDPNGFAILFDEYYEANKTVDYHAARIQQKIQQHGRAPDIKVADPSVTQRNGVTGTSIHQEYVKYGIPFTLGNNDIRAGLIRVRKYFNPVKYIGLQRHELMQSKEPFPRLRIAPNCTNTIWELKRYHWKVYRDKKLREDSNLQEVPHPKDDHLCDALRYCIMTQPDLYAELPDSSFSGAVQRSMAGVEDQLERLGDPAIMASNTVRRDVADPFGSIDRHNLWQDGPLTAPNRNSSNGWEFDEHMGAHY